MASERRAPFRLRAQIARGTDQAEVAAAAKRLPATVIALHDGDVPAAAISRMMAGIHDTIVRRLIELAHDDLGAPPVPYTWLATGSYGRREPFPSSDMDCAMAWEGEGDDPELRALLAGVGRACPRGPRRRAGFRWTRREPWPCRPLFARSIEDWEQRSPPGSRSRPGARADAAVGGDGERRRSGARRRSRADRRAARRAPGRDAVLRRLRAAALAERPPTGFFRDFVLHSTGERKRSARHQARRAAADRVAGALGRARARGSARPRRASACARRRPPGRSATDDVAALRDALELIAELRMEHQVEQLRAGGRPTT